MKMSVIKQNFTTVNGSLECLDNVLLYCVQSGAFVCDDPPESIKHVQRVINESETNPYLSLKNKLALISERFGYTKKPKKRKPNIKNAVNDTFNIYELHKYVEDKEKELTELSNKVQEIDRRITEDNSIIEQLTHLKNIDTDLNELFAFEFIKVRFGYLPKNNYERFNYYVENTESVIFFPSSIEEDYVWGIYFALSEKAFEIDSILASLGFARIHISERVSGIPAQALDNFSEEVDKLKTEYETLKSELYDYSIKLQEQIEGWEDTLNDFSNVFEMKKKVQYNKYGFTLYGWISKNTSKKFITDIKAIGSVNIVADDPSTNTSLSPPVVLKNFFIFRPFQNFVEMYGMPSYNEIDPTPIVAVTYCLFFGIMFGDIGQGAILILAGLFMWYIKRMWLGKIVSVIGLFSIAMGFFYGNIFGNEELLGGFKPNHNINTLLISAVGMGILMITLCSIVNIINGVRQKRIDKVIFSPNGLLGLILYWSILILILGMVNMFTLDIPEPLLIILIIASILLLLFASPLSKLIEHKKDWLPKNKAEFIVENFFELFEVALSFVTNTISFIRIGAFALVHSGMMKVVFLLAETSTGYNPIILIVGNILVIALEGLIVGIQVLRLEFFELFSRFYEGNGRKAANTLNEKED